MGKEYDTGLGNMDGGLCFYAYDDGTHSIVLSGDAGPGFKKEVSKELFDMLLQAFEQEIAAESVIDKERAERSKNRFPSLFTTHCNT